MKRFMEKIVLQNETAKKELLSATFLPKLGLNLASYKKNSMEVVDQTTKEAFFERFSGLGPIIGPHFFRMEENKIVHPLRKDLFPHIDRVLKRGQKDPFSHGIGRYVPWTVEHTCSTLSATLQGHDRFEGAYLKDLEGFDFSMFFEAKLLPDGLDISMSVSADQECVCGLHYYFALENKKGRILSPIQNTYNDGGTFKPLEKNWIHGDDNLLNLPIDGFVDYGFLPLFEKGSSWVKLHTGSRSLQVDYQGDLEAISCQIYSPKEADFVCIEPISAKNPRALDKTSNRFHAKISII